MKPRIAIPVPNSDASYSDGALPDYLNSLEGAGAEVVLLPLTLASAEVAQLAKSCDGVLLPGSPADVDPQKYGQAAHPKTAKPDAARDNLDELLLQDAFNMRKPLLGICYGTQTLNVWRGGTLLQHIESAVRHERPDDVPRGTPMQHPAVVAAESLLASITGPGEITVNSSHHQAVATVGDGLRVVAHSPADGVIEAIEGTAAAHWVLGLQWHPERTFASDENSRRIFARLIEEARHFHYQLAQNSPDFESLRGESPARPHRTSF